MFLLLFLYFCNFIFNDFTLKIMKNQTIIERASWIAIIGNFILAALKINLGLMAGSLAVIGDGIDSSTDIITSLITLLTARLIMKPPSTKYPFGYKRADAIATKALSFVIFFAGLQLGISTISKLIEGESSQMPNLIAVYVTIFSIFSKLFLAFYLKKMGKKVQSSMLIANGKNMQNDVIISSSVLLGLIFTFILKTPLLDSITALLVSLWIMKGAYEIFREVSIELMDGVEDDSIYKAIYKQISKVKDAYNPHRMRVRKIGNQYTIEIDIEVDGEMTVKNAHKISEKIEHEIKENIENIYDIVIHIEPLGNIEKDEKFGISHKDLNNKNT